MALFDSSSAFARVLNRILHEGRFTAVELAMEADCSDRQIGYAASEERSLSVEKAERIARYLCKHGDTRLAQVFLCPSYAVVRRAEGTANGSVQDELLRIVEALGDVSRGHGQRDVVRLDEALSIIRTALADIEAERAQL